MKLKVYTQRDLLVYVLLYALAFGVIAVVVHWGNEIDRQTGWKEPK